MIQQLILSTLIACQPKTETETPEPVLDKPSVETPTEAAPKEVPIVEEKPVVTQQDSPGEQTKTLYSTDVKTGDIPYPRDSYSDEQFCNHICSRANASGAKRLSNIENCQLELIENWEALRKDYHWEKKNEYNPTVGSVECNGTITYVRRGRSALSPTKGTQTTADLGGYFARAAQEEMTAIFAFQEMLHHLELFGAPEQLRRDCEKAIADEKRHMIMMSHMARRHGCKSALVQIPKQQSVSLFELAKHNALAGCIDETWAALIAEYQAKHTTQYAKLFRIIATDEISHAQLSWDIHHWLLNRLSPQESLELKLLMKDRLRKPPPSADSSGLGEMNDEVQKKAWSAFQKELQPLIT